MTQTLASGYSYESAQRELSNEYQHDRVQMVFKIIYVLAHLMELVSALKGLTLTQNVTGQVGPVTPRIYLSYTFFFDVTGKNIA